ncbi:MAG TPA: hypothetical protein VG899_03195, partial [Mycobacteriales bacterium]|nr:hypothetical protein [Mycobacteriales bacterium]
MKVARLLAVIGVAEVVFLLAVIFELTRSTDPNGPPKSYGGVAFGVLFMIGFALLGYAAIHHEHQLRSALSQQRYDGVTPSLPPATSFLPRRGSQKHGPVFAGFAAVAMTGLTIVLVVGVFSAKTDGERSHLTQTHGLRGNVTVESVDNIKHTGRYGSVSYTSTVTVDVLGGVTAVVHDPQYASFSPGQQVEVLLDPKDPSYAEFPGVPDEP